VKPGTLVLEDAIEAAEGCKHILDQEGFPTVQIAFRDSIVTQSVGPKLLSFDPYTDDTVATVRTPFTPALGIRIAPLRTPHFEGTGAIYLLDNETEDILLLTACHVARPPAVVKNNELLSREESNAACEEIVVLGSRAFTSAVERMRATAKSESLCHDMEQAS